MEKNIAFEFCRGESIVNLRDTDKISFIGDFSIDSFNKKDEFKKCCKFVNEAVENSTIFNAVRFNDRIYAPAYLSHNAITDITIHFGNVEWV